METTSTHTLQLTTPTDREIVMTRVFDAPRQLVFAALTTPELLKRWLLGPPGWEMVVCEVFARPGDRYRYVWRHADGRQMSIHGVCRELEPPARIVHSESMEGFPGEILVTTVLVEEDGKTTLTTIQLFDSREGRDMAIKSGMERGVVASYDRLDEVLASAAGAGRATTSLDASVRKPDLVVSHVFEAPVESVWRAWTDPELVMRWWGPKGFTAPMARIDFREGGTSLLCMREPEQLGGRDLYSTWTYQRIEPLQRIEYVHNLADQNGNKIDPAVLGMPADFPQDLRHAVVFSALPDGRTEMTITQLDWPAGRMMELSKLGLEQCLDKMSAALADAGS